MSARFRDYDSAERGTLCLLYADDGHGDYLGSVWKDNEGSWHWEADDGTEGEEQTRRLAKRALRKHLKP